MANVEKKKTVKGKPAMKGKALPRVRKSPPKSPPKSPRRAVPPKPRQDALPEEVRMFIIELNACYVPPAVVAERVRETFDITVSRQSTEGYNPLKAVGKNLSAAHTEYFHERRAQFNAVAQNVGIAQQAFRLNELDELYHRARGKNNTGMSLEILERAAKEVGGIYTKAVTISGPNGGPISIETTEVPLTPEQRQARIKELVDLGSVRAIAAESADDGK